MKANPEFKEIEISDEWFKVYQIKPDLFIFSEPYHFEQALSSLLVGKEKAVVIDTGCGIGDLRKAIKRVTNLPIMVVNTHTHTDHIGSNHQFDNIAMFNHPLSHQVSESGVPHQKMQEEILVENLIDKSLINDFTPSIYSLPPFMVSHWLDDGDTINFDRRELLVIHTPGEAENHICLLDKEHRLLFCGDILMHGSIWTYLEGGSLVDLIASYEKLMGFVDDFDCLIPSHNEPIFDKGLLPETLAAAKKVLSGDAEYEEKTDPWNRKIREYSFGRFQILTNPTVT